MSQKIFFAGNLKFLRERRKLTQQALGDRFGFTQGKVDSLETGRVKSPKAEDLLTFSDFFKISVDSLLRVDLRRLSELKLRELEAGNDVYLTGSGIRVLAITVNEHNKENVEYVPVRAKAGYSSGCSDPEYIASLPRITLPNLPRSGTFRMFPSTGDSMLPIPEGSDIIGQFVENWSTLKPRTPCVVILKGSQDFVFKLVTVQQNREVLLESLNSLYKPYTVAADDVLEVWKYYKHQTGTLPDGPTDLQEIKQMLSSLHNSIKK